MKNTTGVKSLFESEARSCPKQMFVVGAFPLKINRIELKVFIQRYISVFLKTKKEKPIAREQIIFCLCSIWPDFFFAPLVTKWNLSI